MEKFTLIGHNQACCVTGGKKSPEDRFARTLGRLIGAALRVIYDTLVGDKSEPQAAGCW